MSRFATGLTCRNDAIFAFRIGGNVTRNIEDHEDDEGDRRVPGRARLRRRWHPRAPTCWHRRGWARGWRRVVGTRGARADGPESRKCVTVVVVLPGHTPRVLVHYLPLWKPTAEKPEPPYSAARRRKSSVVFAHSSFANNYHARYRELGNYYFYINSIFR